VRTVLSECPSS